MNERQHHLEGEALLQAVRDHVNAAEDLLRQDRFENVLFHEHYVSHPETNEDDLDALREEFMREKRETSFQGRFEMAISPKYLDKIKVVELGVTTRPTDDGEFDALKGEYLKLKDWMISVGMIEDEMSRDVSNRFYTVSMPHEITKDLLVISRTRPLVSQVIRTPDAQGIFQPVQIDIAKRMVFSIPAQYLQIMAQRFGAQTEDGRMSISEVERALNDTEFKDHLDSLLGTFEPIDSIRSAYFMHTEVLSV